MPVSRQIEPLTREQANARKLLTLAECARITARHPTTMAGWVKRGILPGVEVGRRTMVPADALFALLEGHKDAS